METTYIVKFQNRNNKSIRILVFFGAKRGRGKDLEKIILKVIDQLEKSLEILHMFYIDQMIILMNCFLIKLWTNKEALEEHFKRPYIEDLDSSIEQLLAKEIELKGYSE